MVKVIFACSEKTKKTLVDASDFMDLNLTSFIIHNTLPIARQILQNKKEEEEEESYLRDHPNEKQKLNLKIDNKD